MQLSVEPWRGGGGVSGPRQAPSSLERGKGLRSLVVLCDGVDTLGSPQDYLYHLHEEPPCFVFRIPDGCNPVVGQIFGIPVAFVQGIT